MAECITDKEVLTQWLLNKARDFYDCFLRTRKISNATTIIATPPHN